MRDGLARTHGTTILRRARAPSVDFSNPGADNRRVVVVLVQFPWHRSMKGMLMKRLIAISVTLFLPVVVFAEDGKNLLKPVNKAESWRLEQHEGAKATLKADDDAVVIDATKLTGTNWHIQAFQVDLDLKEGKEYTLKLKLAASHPRKVLLVAMIDTDDWHEIGLHEDLSVDKEVRSFDFTFRATGIVTKKNRIGFVMGDETGDLIVKDMTLTEKSDSK
jgi:hypothetical protein